MFSAVLLILQALKIEFDVAYVNEIFTAVLGLLVVVGIIIDPTKTAEKNSQTKKESENFVKKDEAKTNLPIAEENEVNNINNENDFQTILNKIAQDLEIKIKEMGEINKDAAKVIVSLQKSQCCEEIKPEEEQLLQKEAIVDVEIKEKQEILEPAVAEMENPYFNL